MTIKSGYDAASQGLYTDLNQLQKLKGQAGSDRQAALEGAAKQFEQLFMNMMMKSMREANDVLATDSPFNSSDVKFYQGMFDEQLTLELSRTESLGLADIIVQQLGQRADAVTRPASDREDDAERSLTEQMLNRALGNGPVMQPAGTAYQAPVEAEPSVNEDDAVAAGKSVEVPVAAELPGRFETPAQFVEQLLPLAQRAARALGVTPSILLAQAALETGWGKFITRDAGSGQSSHNLFNIKADRRWQGEAVQVQTLEYRGGVPEKEQARFRAYDSYADSFSDYVDFLRANPRYRQALENGADPARFVRELHEAGYATDPEYAAKIERIFNGEWLAGVDVRAQEG